MWWGEALSSTVKPLRSLPAFSWATLKDLVDTQVTWSSHILGRSCRCWISNHLRAALTAFSPTDPLPRVSGRIPHDCALLSHGHWTLGKTFLRNLHFGMAHTMSFLDLEILEPCMGSILKSKECPPKMYKDAKCTKQNTSWKRALFTVWELRQSRMPQYLSFKNKEWNLTLTTSRLRSVIKSFTLLCMAMNNWNTLEFLLRLNFNKWQYSPVHGRQMMRK